MVPISLIYNGELRCTATHDNSGTSFVTDAPKDNFGKGESFSPTDLVATALGTCMITTMGIIAKKENLGVNLDGTRIAIEKHMSTDPPRRIARVVARIVFPGGISRDVRPRLKEIGDNCPVAKSINPNIVLDVVYTYPD
ncbi:MAG: OsmC family protein [Ignavibacteriales bacterium]|nr:OsmC family protein [Ignavibacteriales bacterium]